MSEVGLSQFVFWERCGYFQTYMCRLERGQANPTIKVMEDNRV